MFIKDDDLDFLLDLEKFIYECGINYNEINKKSDDELDKIFASYFYKLYAINEKLLNMKKEKNKKNWECIKEKRKINKNYARSKKEIEKRKNK